LISSISSQWGWPGWFRTARIDRAPPSIWEFGHSCVRGRRARGTIQATLSLSLLRIPPIAFLLGELGCGAPRGFSNNNTLKSMRPD